MFIRDQFTYKQQISRSTCTWTDDDYLIYLIYIYMSHICVTRFQWSYRELRPISPMNGMYSEMLTFSLISPTDGASTVNMGQTVPTAEEARRRGIQMFSVGITDKINENELRGISSPPQRLHENYFLSTDFRNLGEILEAVVSATCTSTGGSGRTWGTWWRHGNVCRITGPLWGESTGHQWIPLTKGPVMPNFDVSLIAWSSCWTNSRVDINLRRYDAYMTSV